MYNKGSYRRMGIQKIRFWDNNFKIAADFDILWYSVFRWHYLQASFHVFIYFSGVRCGGFPYTVNVRILKSFVKSCMEYGMCLLQSRQARKPLIRAEQHILSTILSGCRKSSRNALLNLANVPSIDERIQELSFSWVLNAQQRGPGFISHHLLREPFDDLIIEGIKRNVLNKELIRFKMISHSKESSWTLVSLGGL